MTTTTPQSGPTIVPDFGDNAPTGRKLAIICSKGNLDMAYPGLILANAALGEGVETHLFFTFWGFDMITKSRMGELKFTMLGNTATHMPQGLGGLPGMTAIATHQMRKQIHDIGVPDVPEFLAQIVDSGGHLWACRMSADMMHLDESDLYEAVEGIISAADFIDKTDGAQLLFEQCESLREDRVLVGQPRDHRRVVQQHEEDEERADRTEDRRRVGLDSEPARDRVEPASPDREGEQHGSREQPEQRITLAQPARADQLEDGDQQQERGDRRGNRNGKWCHRWCSSSNGTA